MVNRLGPGESGNGKIRLEDTAVVQDSNNKDRTGAVAVGIEGSGGRRSYRKEGFDTHYA